jgi:hypothetical protein
MSLINIFEILPSKKEKLNSYLYTELKNQCAWRDNKSDAILDQHRYFESYFGKDFKNNYINKDLIFDYLKESEKAHHLQINSKILNKSKFLELDLVTNTDQDFYLYYYDNDDKHFNLVNFDLSKGNREMSLKNLEEYSLNFDTSIRQIVVPQSNYFRSVTNFVNRCLIMDMYSIYSIDFEKLCDDETKVKKFDKFLTLEEIPNTFMSNTFLDKFFIVSHSNTNTINNRVSLIDDNFKISAIKDFNIPSSHNSDNKNRQYKRGEFMNHPMIIFLYKNIGEIIVSDFRVNFSLI